MKRKKMNYSTKSEDTTSNKESENLTRKWGD